MKFDIKTLKEWVKEPGIDAKAVIVMQRIIKASTGNDRAIDAIENRVDGAPKQEIHNFNDDVKKAILEVDIEDNTKSNTSMAQEPGVGGEVDISPGADSAGSGADK